MINAEADKELNWLVDMISRIRTLRGEMNVPPGAKVPLILKGASAETIARVGVHRALIDRLARLSEVTFGDDAPSGSIQDVVGEATIMLPLADIVDLEQEKKRLEKEIDKVGGEIVKIDKKLANQEFLSKAPPEIVEENRERKAEAEKVRIKLADALRRLQAA
ncbi:MAG: hypothetical protein OXD42_10655 [Rhodospirillaceae bacterium]|nr:hypothetical protein [Rhodospirillaceae bacterium]